MMTVKTSLVLSVLFYVQAIASPESGWRSKLEALESQTQSNLVAVASKRDSHVVLDLYKELTELSTHTSRGWDENSVSNLFSIKITLFKTVTSMRDWHVRAETYAPDYKQLPRLSREAMMALGEYKGRYDKIPEQSARQEILDYMEKYNCRVGRYRFEKTLEKIQTGLEQSMKEDLFSEGQLNQRCALIFKNLLNIILDDDELKNG